MFNKITLHIIAILFISIQLSAQSDTTFIKINNESSINSDQLEYSPVFFEDGIVFISTKNVNKKKIIDKKINNTTMSIFLSKRNEEGKLQEPKLFSNNLVNKYHEGPMCIDRTAEHIYFTQNNVDSKGKLIKAEDGISKLGIFSSEKQNGEWGNVIPSDLNNIQFNTCHPSISVDGDYIIFSSDRDGGFGGMDLYKSKKNGDEWGKPINLGSGVNSEGNDVFPFIHADGTLYYASDGIEGKGGLDVYYTWEDKNGQWIKSTNIDAPINTSFDDFGLILDRDKRNGYLSSNRPGKGQDDIFNFHVKNEKGIDILGGKNKQKIYKDIHANFKNSDGEMLSDFNAFINEIKNISKISGTDGIQLEKISDKNYVLNTNNEKEEIESTISGTDLSAQIKTAKTYIVTFEKEGYINKQFVLNPNSPNNNYTFIVEQKTECLTLNGSVLRTITNAPIANALVKIRSKFNLDDIQTLTTNKNGLFEYCIKCGENYEVAVSSDGQTVGKTIETKASDCVANNILKVDFFLEPLLLEAGTIIELPNIYYNFNDASLRPDAVTDLEGLITILHENPSMEIELSSHTDSRGTEKYNNRLSQKRANNVVSYLINRGISLDRVRGKGFGESQIRNQCVNGVRCSEEEHQFNRRTEVRITKIDTPEIPVTYKNEEMPLIDHSLEDYKGYYLVIAGSFLIEQNATLQLSKVQNVFYKNSRIVKLNNSEYYSVIVEKYATIEEAKNLIFELRDKKIAAFIKKI